MWKLDVGQKDLIVARYLSGESSAHIARDFDIHPTNIRGILRRRGVQMRTNREAQTRLPLNHEAFDILTPEAAYWCGFIAADGAICQRSGAAEVAIVLACKDEGHLRKFRDFLGSAHALTPVASAGYQGSTGSVRFSVRSQRLADRLTELGVKAGPVANELASSRDFWRGVVDGDGWVTTDAANPRLDVVGYPYLLNPFVAFLASHGIEGPSVRPHKSISRIVFSSFSAIRTADILWRDCTVSLDRNHDAAIAVAAATPRAVVHGEAHGNSKLTAHDVQEIRRLYEGGGISHRQMGALFGVSHGAIGAVLRGKTWVAA